MEQPAEDVGRVPSTSAGGVPIAGNHKEPRGCRNVSNTILATF